MQIMTLTFSTPKSHVQTVWKRKFLAKQSVGHGKYSSKQSFLSLRVLEAMLKVR